jgi:hypothetical protein
MQLQRGVLVKHDLVELVDADAAGFQRMADRQHGKSGIVLDAAEAFFVDGEFDLRLVE